MTLNNPECAALSLYLSKEKEGIAKPNAADEYYFQRKHAVFKINVPRIPAEEERA